MQLTPIGDGKSLVMRIMSYVMRMRSRKAANKNAV